ncbi:GNAT family N-acetyltransferase [Porticoccus sp. W117]|uniref:GNAT family N-acetyltransferase n=1 Tax=Porticoccus sp. W117 TaxID=3054777 RepID=UPI002597DBA7|nr:GNAT family N-acetyltransferase [Porticoccus sp. W117]MDM3872608.1 GNAT family N-acetyltransferase [Porticoccus sp. W117]
MEDIEFTSLTIKPATWQQDQQLLMSVRQPVFVEEQQVPVDIEIDDKEPLSAHWLAYGADGQAIGTARLEPSGKVGRMAVLSQHRGTGVGSALLRRIILDASSEGHTRLHLHAQCHALAFYKQFGFVAFGDVFDEAGIKHQAMELDLGPYRHRARESSVINTPLENFSALSQALQKAVAITRRKIRWYSEQFDDDLLTSIHSGEALRQFLNNSSNCEVQLLIRDIDPDSGRQHPLLALQRTLDSRFQIRQCDRRDTTPDWPTMVLLDDDQLLRSGGGPDQVGQWLQQAAADVRHQEELFDALWQRSPVPVEVQQLNISG